MAALIVAISCLLVVVWYLVDPAILQAGALFQTGFILLNLIMVAAAGIAGYIGGKLVFKD